MTLLKCSQIFVLNNKIPVYGFIMNAVLFTFSVVLQVLHQVYVATFWCFLGKAIKLKILIFLKIYIFMHRSNWESWEEQCRKERENKG